MGPVIKHPIAARARLLQQAGPIAARARLQQQAGPIAARARLLRGWGAFADDQAALVPGRR
jgi:hypothetical protein